MGALGCNYKQCVQKRWECDRDKGANKHAEAEIKCVAAAMHSSMHPGHFVTFFMAMFVSMLMCIGGCLSGQSAVPGSHVRDMTIIPKPRLPEGFGIVELFQINARLYKQHEFTNM